MTVAIVGNLSVDRVADAVPRPGGGVYYGAIGARRLGIDARVAARCAERDREVALAPLSRIGLPVSFKPAAATTCFSFHYEGEHRVMEVEAIGDPWTPGDITGWAAPALAGAGWVHVGALLRSDFAADTLRAAAAGGRKLLVDAQGLLRHAETGPLRRDADVDPSLLASVHVLKLSEDEAQLLAGGLDPASLRALGVPEVVLTLGSEGSVVVTSDGEERVPAERVPGVDPTGAGDMYAIGYLAARADGFPPGEAARKAGALVTTLLSERT